MKKALFITDGKKLFDLSTKELCGYIHKIHKKNTIAFQRNYCSIIVKIPNDLIIFTDGTVLKTVFYNTKIQDTETVYSIGHLHLTGFALCGCYDIVSQDYITIEQYLTEYNEKEDVTL